MILFATAMLWAVVLPLVVALSVFIVEVSAGLMARPGPVLPAVEGAIAILVPAHDEAATIGGSLAALRAQIDPGVRVIVIADNCSDETAAIAHASGAEVVERNDPVQRGKGFALAAGRDLLALGTPPVCVIVLDADCVPQGKSVALLRDAVVAWGQPVQATNLLAARLSDPPLVQISNFAFLVKNLVRQRGIAALGGAALLGGTGMAFPWPFFRDAALATGNIVEDLGLGIEATRRGDVPRFLEAARVESPPAALAATIGQRSRWEGGFLQTAWRLALPLVVEGAQRGRWPLFWLGLHLLVPPLALLLLAAGGAMLIVTAIGFAIDVFGPAVCLAVPLTIAVVVVLLAWARFGRATLAGGTLLRLPAYVLWKIPLYLSLLRRRSTGWVRTPRS